MRHGFIRIGDPTIGAVALDGSCVYGQPLAREID
jgi:hypothetical protein